VRALHFGRDRYRLAWVADSDVRRADVLAVDLKAHNFYNRLRERWLEFADRLRGADDD